MKKMFFSFLFTSFLLKAFSQGGIEHLKNQPYMKMAGSVNCDDPDGDNLSGVICSNLKYQKSDSLLTVIYNRLLAAEETDSTRKYIIQLQKEWRAFRDKHCVIVWDRYKEGAGHFKRIIYLECLTELTNHRSKELESLLEE